MKKVYQSLGVSVVSLGLILSTGCESPDGTPDNTGTGALIGGAVGAIAGAASSDGRHSGETALVGALVGAIAGGLVGHMIDEDQRERLQAQSPETLATIQHNDEVARQQAAYPAEAAPAPVEAGQPEVAQAQAAPGNMPTPLKVSDIEALTAAGVTPEAIIRAIKESGASSYTSADIATAEQSTPPVDSTVIEYMEHPNS